MKRVVKYVAALILGVAPLMSAVAGLTNQSIADMQENYWGEMMLPCQFGTTFSSSDEQGEDSGYDNIPLNQIFRLNMSVAVPDGYVEVTNGNFRAVGAPAAEFAIVNNPKDLCSDLSDLNYDANNRLVMHNVPSGSDALTINVKNFDTSYANDVIFKMNVDEVSGLGSGSATFGLFLGNEKIDEVIVNSGIDINWFNDVTIDKSKLSSKFTLSIRRTDNNANANQFVLAFSEIMLTGSANVISGVTIAIKNDEGPFMGTKVEITASAAEGIADDDVYWESKPATGDWQTINYRGLELVDVPRTAGVTLYRAKYNGAEDPTYVEWIYSNEVSVTRIQACDGKLSNQLFFENFGTLENEKAHKSCPEVPYRYMDTCQPVQQGGEYAVVANAKWAGCDNGGAGTACNEGSSHYWFREDLRSVGGDTNGGMLLLNCNNGGENDILYRRSETVYCPNTTVTFSFFVAQASKSASDPINFQVQLVSNGQMIAMEEYNSGTLTKDDGWKAGSMQFNTGSNTSFEIRVVNYAKYGGNGNDILLDNLAFSICTPSVDLSKAESSPGVVIGKRVKADCNDNVVLVAEADAAGISNPYFLWVLRENGGDFMPSQQLSGSNKDRNTFIPTENNSYSAYVILAQDENTAVKYFNGEDVGCSPVSVTDTMSVICSIPKISYQRECDVITLEANINPGDQVTWYKSTDGGATWTSIGQQTAGASDIVLTKEVEITENTIFKIRTYSEGVASEVSTEEVKYLAIALGISKDDVSSYVPEDTEATIERGSCAYFYPRYTGFELSRDSYHVMHGNDEVVSGNWTSPSFLCDLNEGAELYATYNGCRSNDVKLNVAGTISIEEVSRDCNTVTLKANTTSALVQWWYRGTSSRAWSKDGGMRPASETYTHTVDYSANDFRASISDGGLLIYSSELYESPYNVTIAGNDSHQGAYEEGEIIYADYNEQITLHSGNGTSLFPGGKVQFYSIDGVLLYEEDYTMTKLVEYTFNAASDGEYYLMINGCRSGNISVVINPEVSIESEHICNTYTFTATVKGTATLHWYFQNVQGEPFEIPGTEGQLQITYEASEYGMVTAEYGQAAAGDEVEFHSVVLEADQEIVEKGDEVVFNAGPGDIDQGPWMESLYSELYMVNGGKVGNQQHSVYPSWTYAPQKTAVYYVQTEDGCRSNEVTVKVKGTVQISADNNCNKYTIKAETEGEGDLIWQKASNDVAYIEWSDIEGSAGKTELVMDVTEDTQIRAKYGEAYSDPVYLEYYELTLTAEPTEIVIGAETVVTLSDGEQGGWLIDYGAKLYDRSGKLIDDTMEQFTWNFKLACDNGFYAIANNGCRSNDVNISVMWPTIFTPYDQDGFNDDFMVGADPSVSIKVFDRTGNNVASSEDGWDGTVKDGSLAMPDVYYYVADVEGCESRRSTVEIYKK